MSGEAPPKLVAMAMEKLGQASRLIADIRLGADRFLEVLFVSAQPHLSNKPLHLFIKEDESVRHHLQDLRNIGRELAELGVLNESLRARSNYWGLHMPLVCPDGAVVAYAWKRQLAAQAGASAVDRTRLALKAFTDQKRRVFPHLDDDLNCQIVGTEAVEKKHNVSQLSTTSQQEEPNDFRLQDVLISLQKEIPVIEVSTYQRLDWLKRATSLSAHETSVDLLKEHSFHDPNNHKPESLGVSAASRMSIIEMLCPSVFRAIVSLHPAGSVEPSSVAFYSPYERGSYIHARGSSIYQVYRHISEHAAMALQYFLGNRREMALSSLLHWICSYQFLFTKACSKCGRLLSMEKNSALLLPPVCRPYRQPSKDRIPDLFSHAFHVNCFAEQVYLYLD